MSETQVDVDEDVATIKENGERIGSAVRGDSSGVLSRDVHQVYQYDGDYYVITQGVEPKVVRVSSAYAPIEVYGQGLNNHETKQVCIKSGAVVYNHDEATFDEVVTVPGQCTDCGADLEFIYDKVGIRDPDADEYITEF